VKLKHTETTGHKVNSIGYGVREVTFEGTEVRPICRAWWAEFTMGSHKELVQLPDGKTVVVDNADLEA
jgi:hypothetical protein